MATRDTAQPGGGISRRDFLKATAATAAVGCGLEFAYDPEKALAYESSADYKVTYTTCPYCSASCGQRVVTDKTTGEVVDLYGDFESPMNSGGLCSKGAGSFQLVTNERRLGAFAGPHPEDPNASTSIFGYDPAFADGVAYKRTGNGAWSKVALNTAMTDIAGRMKSARGPIGTSGTVSTVFASAGETIDSVAYTGFSGLQAIKRADGKYFVITNGNKVNAATLGATLTPPMTPAKAQALVDSFDELVFVAEDPTDRATYSLVGRGDLGDKLWAQGVLGNTAHVIVDGSDYVAYVSDATGVMHTATSPDMLVWTYGVDMGTPGGIAGLKSPSIIKSGSNVHCWFSCEAPANNTTLYFSTYNGATWTAAVPVTVGGVATTNFTGHPYVELSGTNYVMHYCPNGTISKAVAPVGTPATFAAATNVHSSAVNLSNVSAGPNWVLFMNYNTLMDPLGWAYSGVQSVMTASLNNSKSVAFFGSSHMNNESNYIYRKIIANFGTSNTEHQARI